jgi:hypothetical protein
MHRMTDAIEGGVRERMEAVEVENLKLKLALTCMQR